MAERPEWMTSTALRDGQSADMPVRKDLTIDSMDVLPTPRQIRFVVSDGSVDRDNDVIEPGGWDLSQFVKNPVILWAHSHKDLPIGRATEIRVEDGKLVATAEFAAHPFADTVWELIKGGFIRATSVGFRALEWAVNEERQGVDFKRQELLEFSVVPVPANPNALVAASSRGVDLEPLRAWVQDTIEAWPGEIRLKGSVWDKMRGPSEQADAATEPGLSELIGCVDRLVEAMRPRVITTAGHASGTPVVCEPVDPVLEFESDDADDLIELSESEVQGALGVLVRDTVSELVRDATERTIRQWRGRLD